MTPAIIVIITVVISVSGAYTYYLTTSHSTPEERPIVSPISHLADLRLREMKLPSRPIARNIQKEDLNPIY